MEKANQMLNKLMQKKQGNNGENKNLNNNKESKENKEENKEDNKDIDNIDKIDITVKTKPKKKETPNVITTYEFETNEQEDADEYTPKIEYENFNEQEDD